MQLQSTLINAPVKPHPDTPPLSVKIVITWPIYRHKSSAQWQSLLKCGICVSHLSFVLRYVRMDILINHYIMAMKKGELICRG